MAPSFSATGGIEEHPDEDVHGKQRPKEQDRDALDGEQDEQDHGGRAGQPLVALDAAGSRTYPHRREESIPA